MLVSNDWAGDSVTRKADPSKAVDTERGKRLL